MSYCNKCGTQVTERSGFCPGCGAPVHKGGGHDYGARRSGSHGMENTNDAVDNRMMAILAYIGFLVFIPIFAARESEFARFHSNQGLALFIVEAIYGIVISIINSVMMVSFQWGAWGVLNVIFGLVWILFVVLSILGILNAYRGETKPLPVVGGIQILK